MILRLTLLYAFLWPSLVVSDTLRVAATTEWTGAIARAAGADSVMVISPPGLLHPAEYELTPGDILKLMKADIIIGGGYERMMDKLTRETINTDIPVLKIDTVNHPDSLARAVHFIAARLGTQEKAALWEKGFRHAIEKARRIFISSKGGRVTLKPM